MTWQASEWSTYCNSIYSKRKEDSLSVPDRACFKSMYLYKAVDVLGVGPKWGLIFQEYSKYVSVSAQKKRVYLSIVMSCRRTEIFIYPGKNIIANWNLFICFIFLQINTFPIKWFVLYILHKIAIYSLNFELRVSCLVGSRCSAVHITNPLLFLHLHLLRYRMFIGAFAKAKSKY